MSTVSEIAKVCHEVNRAYCAATGDVRAAPWAYATVAQRESMRRGVEFALEHPAATPADQHAVWLADKIAAGWRYGSLRSEAIKEHPCILPYDQLPQAQRVKDSLFQAIVKAMT